MDIPRKLYYYTYLIEYSAYSWTYRPKIALISVWYSQFFFQKKFLFYPCTKKVAECLSLRLCVCRSTISCQTHVWTCILNGPFMNTLLVIRIHITYSTFLTSNVTWDELKKMYNTSSLCLVIEVLYRFVVYFNFIHLPWSAQLKKWIPK